MPDVLIYSDSVRDPTLRHEVPLGIGDPFLYAEQNGTRRVLISAMEQARMGHLKGLKMHAPEEFGQDELVASGLTREEVTLEVLLRAVQEWGITSATVPPTFPVELADHLRANGIEVSSDRDSFRQRRRAKNEHEIAGIRRAQRAADAGMAAAAEMISRAQVEGDRVLVDGDPLTSERLKRRIEEVFADNDCTAEEFIVSHGPQCAIGHHMGEGEIRAREPIVIDIWPKDRESGCFADMTRTFVVGDPSEELVEWYRLCEEALRDATAALGPGVETSAPDAIVCDIFERAGYKTQRTKEQGKALEEGYFHSLGHGVGLDVHEPPLLSARFAGEELVPGDVVSVEPGLYKPGVGGCRLEDLVLITEDGYEVLTNFPYELR
jgi:Xaa-Pro aminopeptidase